MNTHLITLPGLPPSQNELRTKVKKKIRVETEYKNTVWCELLAQGLVGPVHGFPLGGPGQRLAVEVVYVLGPKKRRSDTLSNREKLLLDALKFAGVIADDFWIQFGQITSVHGPEDKTLIKIRPAVPWTMADVEQWMEHPITFVAKAGR